MVPGHLVAVCGKRHHGKDTFADVFAAEFGFQKIAFADALKQMLNRAYNISSELLYGPEQRDAPFPKPFKPTEAMVEKMLDEIDKVTRLTPNLRQRLLGRLTERAYPTTRAILDHIGTDVLREEVSDRFLIDATAAKFESENVIIPDARTPLERQIIRDEWSGTLVFLIRLGYELEDHGHATHQSLGAPEEFDYVFESHSAEENRAHARKLAEKLLTP